MVKKSVLLLLFVIFAISAGLIIGLTLHFTQNKDDGKEDGKDTPQARTGVVVDCVPEGGATREQCEERNCVYQKSSDGAPDCTFPEGHGYRMSGDVTNTPLGYRFSLERSETPTLFSNDVQKLQLDIEFHTESRLRIRFSDNNTARYEVPEEAVDIPIPSKQPPENTRMYDVTWVKEPQFGVKVTRKSNGAIIFDTTLPGFTFSDQFLQLTTKLNSGHVYGFGEHNHRQFKHNMEWKKWSIFTRDVAPIDEWNLYGAQTLYMNLEQNGDNANGVVLLNSNAMDIVLQPDPFPAISYRVIGGILDYYIFLGPTPENVVQQYTEATGRPLMPPYWSLGFQLCRWDYHNLTHVKTVVERNRQAQIPFDIQYGDIDYMESKLDFTYDKDLYDGLPEFVDDIHAHGQKYIIILDHCIGSDMSIVNRTLGGVYRPLTEGLDQGIYIMDPRDKSKPLEGEVWPGLVHYPDFTLGDRVESWWTDQCRDFYNGSDWGVKYDALWIDMNEPSNFIQGSTTGCTKNKWNYPPYVPNVLGAGDDGKLYDKTICMDAEQHWGKHYDTHNLYGHSMSLVTYNTLRTLFPEDRPLVFTRSNFVGTQKYAMHWLGDNQSQWRQIPWSIVGMLEYSLFGFTYTGADICGFWFEPTEEMCQRWMQVGAFYPFSRNHNGQGWPDQDPAAWSNDLITASRDVLGTRYRLLPYLYTLMHHAHIDGSTVVRPLMHEFHRDNETWAVDRQFLWGPAFMISPAMDEGQRTVTAYFPKDRWYDYYGGKEVETTGTSHDLATPLDKINLHVRGGYIIPWQQPANTTVYSRQNPLGLIVALGTEPLAEAKGDLFWDDGQSFETYKMNNYLHVDFHCAEIQTDHFNLNMTVTYDGYPDASVLFFHNIEVFGLSRKPDSLSVDGTVMKESIDYDEANKMMKIVNLKLYINKDHFLEWYNV